MEQSLVFISEQNPSQKSSPHSAGFVCELCVRQVSHHLHHFHRSIDAQVIEKGNEVFLHLDTVVIHLSDSENAHLALPPHLRDKMGTFTHDEQNVLSDNPQHCVLHNLGSLFTNIFLRQNHINLSQM